MEIFRGLQTFLFNHRRKFLISGVAVGGAVAFFHYFRYQAEKRQKCEVSDFLETLRRERHFETIQSTCDQTISSLCKRLEKQIISVMNIDRIVADLKTSPPKSLDLWQDLKISTFTQVCLVVYGQTLLLFTLKIQFAVMGGYMYKALSLKTDQMSRCMQERYLSLCVSFLKNGLRDLYNHIQLKVTNVISGLDLKKKLTTEGLQDIFWSIQASIDTHEFIDNIPTYLHIEDQVDEHGEPTLKLLYEETMDVLTAKELTSVCVNSLLHCGFTSVMEELYKYMKVDKKNEHPIPTAKLLPVLHNIIKSNSNESEQSSWCKNLMLSEKLKILSANVYESYC